jgi:hypothetical protein
MWTKDGLLPFRLVRTRPSSPSAASSPASDRSGRMRCASHECVVPGECFAKPCSCKEVWKTPSLGRRRLTPVAGVDLSWHARGGACTNVAMWPGRHRNPCAARLSTWPLAGASGHVAASTAHPKSPCASPHREHCPSRSPEGLSSSRCCYPISDSSRG